MTPYPKPRTIRPKPEPSEGDFPVSLQTYKQLVDRCALERLNYAIANGSPFHARVLIAKLFEIAEKQVSIVTGSLRDITSGGIEVYGHEPVVEEAKKFLTDPGTCLTVIVQTGELHRGEENSFLHQVCRDRNRNGTLKLLIPPKGALDQSIPHFMVADGFSYRLETGQDAAVETVGVDDEDGAPHDHMRAVANFGDGEMGRGLKAYFDEIRDVVRKMPGIRELRYSPEANTAHA